MSDLPIPTPQGHEDLNSFQLLARFRAAAQILLNRRSKLTESLGEAAGNLVRGMRRVRPRFQLECAAPPDTVIRYVGELLKTSGCPVSGLSCPGRIELHAHGSDQHLWSPQLIVDVVPSHRGSELLGRFGPHPSVWTMYMAGYAACGFGGLLGASFGYAQWVMGSHPWLLLTVPACLLSALGLYSLAFVGQGAGAGQMKQLRTFLRKALRDVEVREAANARLRRVDSE